MKQKMFFVNFSRYCNKLMMVRLKGGKIQFCWFFSSSSSFFLVFFVVVIR